MKNIQRTVAKMLSNRYEDNLVAELEQTYIRMTDLEECMAAYEEGDIRVGSPLEVLRAQHQAMTVYFGILAIRAEHEGIEFNLKEA